MRKPEKAKHEPPKDMGVLHTDSGTSDVYSSGAPRQKQWTIRWKAMGMGISTQGPTKGEMRTVEAEIFTGKEAGSTLKADSAHASKENKELQLDGNVVATSADRKSVLTCDHLRYVAALKRYYASGNVRFTNPVGSIGTFSQLISTARLDQVATPKEFRP